MNELIGKSIGSYRILEQIGIGGMATIYKAYQPGMDRYVAIKVLPHYLAKDEQFLHRFQREARAIAKLEHAHILPIFDYGEHEGITYIAMRYVEAGTLKEYMSNHRLSLTEISRIIGQVGSALDYAHRQGIIHRDVKPSNVLIDDQGNTYLADFGLARMMESSQKFTASGVSVGTPAYMSPEQGKGVKVDHRSDIYALGVVLFEMATGQVPFEAETPLAVLLKHITDPLPLPHIIRPGIPEPVERVILRALAKEPADRFQSAGEMVQALATAVRSTTDQETIPIRPAPLPIKQSVSEQVPEPASLITQVHNFWQTPQGKAVMIGGTAVVLILFGFLLNWLNRSNVAITAVTQPALTAQPTSISAVIQPTPTTQPNNTTTAASPTPYLTTAPAPTPAQPDEGKTIGMCEGERPLLCIYEVQTGQSVEVSNDLEFEAIAGLAWSPDGKQIAFAGAVDAYHQIYIINSDGTDLRQISSTGNLEGDIDWSPDGEWLAFTSPDGLWLAHPDGSDEHLLLPDNTDTDEFSMAQWSPDSQQLSFVTNSSIWIVDRDGTSPHVAYTSEQPLERHGGAVWGPDGQKMSIPYLEDGKHICLIVNSDGSGEAQKLDDCPISWDQTFWPRWGIELPAMADDTPLFTNSNQRLGDTHSFSVALGDMDNDGDLDAFVANGGEPNRVWLNDGSGSFSSSGQRLDNVETMAMIVRLGDLDGDGDLDAFIGNFSGNNANKIWLNDGTGIFYDSGQNLGNSNSSGVALGDLDGDGDLDAFIGNSVPYDEGEDSGQPNKVWFNNGSGAFTDSGQNLGNSDSVTVALGDLDGDGDLDAFVGNDEHRPGQAQANTVWLNDGTGQFTDSGQNLGQARSKAVALADLDNDGDLDAFVVSCCVQGHEIWFNNGAGLFYRSDQELGGSDDSHSIALGDLDGDGDLDALIDSWDEGSVSIVLLNDGTGHFSASAWRLSNSESLDVALGDLDGDGDLDVFAVNRGANEVWFNQTID